MDDFGDTDLYLEHIEGDVDDDEDEGNTTTPFQPHSCDSTYSRFLNSNENAEKSLSGIYPVRRQKLRNSRFLIIKQKG